MSDGSTPGDVARAFLDAFEANDLRTMRDLLADRFVGHVTTADGATREVGADGYVEAVHRMDVGTAHLRLAMPDVTAVDDRTVLVMVEVHAERGGRKLHNFSGQLLAVDHGRIEELWMVDALPAESDAFWAQ